MGNGIFIKALVWICGLMLLLQLIVAGTIAPSKQLLTPFSLTTAFAAFLAFAFERWMWSWPGISSIVERPDLRGTWGGVIISDWVNPETNSKLPPIPAFMCITQTATTLYLRQFTKESVSITSNAIVDREPDDAEVVVAAYRNDPKSDIRYRSAIHYGALRLRVTGDGELSGEYWTDRKSRGMLKLKRVSESRAKSFDDARWLATVSQS